ncbi:MAG: DUF4411 family protein [Actinobacteria bacterium]|nr:DUF4411 family protein [Actinomycetota bacterium]
MARRRYSLDTCVLIEPWNSYYSMDKCPDYWDIIDELARKDVVFCSEEVRREIKRIDDNLWAWVKARDYLFKKADEEVQNHLRMKLLIRICGSFPALGGHLIHDIRPAGKWGRTRSRKPSG